MNRLLSWLLVGFGLMVSRVFGALEVNLDDEDSIKDAAAIVAASMMSYYDGDQPGKVPGILPGPPPDGPYYWWIGGAMWGTLLDYRHYTGDKTYDAQTMQALVAQSAPTKDFMVPNWTASMGNDDQAFWAFSALIAAETSFTDPAPELDLDWLALGQAVFNEQTLDDVRRVHEGPCKGGVRWQAIQWNRGWDYVNTIANACYFNIGARLARYTGNATYSELASQTFEWLLDHKYISDVGEVFDGAHVGEDCKDVNHQQFSYNSALLIQGAAFMYNITEGQEQQDWASRIDLILNHTLDHFFPKGIAVEPQCEYSHTCTVDMESFRGYLHRWLASCATLASYTAEKIKPILRSSTGAAVKTCNGGPSGNICGFIWRPNDTDPTTDKPAAAAHQMNVLAALTSLLVTPDQAPVTSDNGGTSRGNSDAGQPTQDWKRYPDITTADRVGAAIFTAVVCGGALGAFVWISI